MDERLGFEPAGGGAHVFLHVEKTGCNTAEAGRALAVHAGVAMRDIGYSGLKDRHAVCRQWFSLPQAAGIDWRAFSHLDIRILEVARHPRKLRRGTHWANHFAIKVLLDELDEDDLGRRLDLIRSAGVPNYFGEQRFGRNFSRNAAHLAAGGRLSRLERSMTLSAIRSDLFNRVLDERVRRGSWNIALPGEYVNLDGTRSGFAALDGDPLIATRVGALDVHPTGPLYGSGCNPARGEAADLEDEVLKDCKAWRDLLTSRGMKMERRATRCAVGRLEWRLEAGKGVLRLAFMLRRGQFATVVLRELMDCRDVTRHPDLR